MYIDIPTCSCSGQEASLVKWKCTQKQAQSILQLAKHDKKNFEKQIRKHYAMEDGDDFVVRLFLPSIPLEYIDYKWELRMLYLLMKYLELERLMWNLSTLGGACSAMADYDMSFVSYYLVFILLTFTFTVVFKAKRAGEISEKQMRIAAELDDRTLLARCHLYIALSAAQQADFAEAKRIVRYERFHMVIVLAIKSCLMTELTDFSGLFTCGRDTLRMNLSKPVVEECDRRSNL
ncbi:hypothetical protein ANCCEY_07125 [Ancylostoma ceylanicum]|uniref:Uncharacterized protein n=1 Tax=Ancylostoma ceylanicum TaxID=53326 RepID=A0A0D6LRI3_9BILA|nr:hypothetical protein ANCCEY_07125 [Ancylostoma ceylanicum]